MVSNKFENEQSIYYVREMVLRSFFENIFYNQDEDGDTQLHLLIANGKLYEDLTLYIINATADGFQFNLLNNDSYSALHIAALAKSPKIIERLIRRGANSCFRNRDGNTALHLACINNDPISAQSLMYRDLPENNVDHAVVFKYPRLQELTIYNHDGYTCLHIAVINDNKELVNGLLLYGADIEAKTRTNGVSALHIAAEFNFIGLAKLLLRWKANVHAENYAGKTAYSIAMYHNNIGIAKLLIKFGARRRAYTDSENDSEDFSSSEVF